MSNRVKVIYITGDYLARFLEEGIIHPAIVKKGLPRRTEFQYAFPTTEHHGIGLVFSHPSWDEVQSGNLIPILKVEIEQLIVK